MGRIRTAQRATRFGPAGAKLIERDSAIVSERHMVREGDTAGLMLIRPTVANSAALICRPPEGEILACGVPLEVPLPVLRSC